MVEKYFQSSDDNGFQVGILYSAKICNKYKIKVKIFSDMKEREICFLQWSIFFSSSAIENSFYLDSFQLSLKKNTFSSLFFLCSYGWLSGYLTRFCQWYIVNVLWGGFMGISLKEREWPPLILPIYRYSSWSSNIHFCFFGFLENDSGKERWKNMSQMAVWTHHSSSVLPASKNPFCNREIKFYLKFHLVLTIFLYAATSNLSWHRKQFEDICQLMRNWILFWYSVGHVTIFWQWSAVEVLWQELHRTVWT